MPITSFKTRFIAAAALVAAGTTLSLPLLLPTAALAQARVAASATPQINAFDVQPVERLVPGAELAFTLWGTPGAAASLRIDGARRALVLDEDRPGVYTGVYTVSQRDRIAPDARVSANLRRANLVDTALLDEPLQRDAAPDPAAADVPQIDRFSITQGGDRQGGNLLDLRVTGTPGARVTVNLPGSQTRPLRLAETQPGTYQLRYAVPDGEPLRPDAAATARLRLGPRSAVATLDRALAGLRLTGVGGEPALCLSCGTVLAVNRIAVQGDGSYVGTVAGGLLGAVLGSQVGKGDGRTAAGVAGAVGGALLGREVDKRRTAREHHEVVLRMDDGRREVVTLDDAPPWKAGDHVRLVDGQLQADRG